MEVEYQVTIDDVIRFNLYHVAHSPFGRRQKWLTRYPVAISLPIFGLLDYVFTGKVAPLVTFCLIALVWYAVTPAWWEWDVGRRTRKVLGEGMNRGLLGPSTLTIGSEGLRVVGDTGETSLKWSAVERVACSGTHTYIYLGATSALMIPHCAFANESTRDRFIDEANRYREGYLGLPPISP